jgi:hypothetical protein
MFSLKRMALLNLAIVVLLFCSSFGYGQSLYSYTDESGVRVFTNIPPKSPVKELKTIGAPAESLAPPPSPTFQWKTAYDPIIDKYATEYNLDPSLIRSMIATESAFNPKAVSNKGAQGLMQLMPSTASRLGVRNPFDPEQNIKGGVKHMRYLLDAFDNDLSLSLAAYNAGENLVQRLGRVPNIRETHNYVQTITKRYGKKTVAPLNTPQVTVPSTYRYVDDNGVLHLTSIPPAQRINAESPGWAIQSQLLP